MLWPGSIPALALALLQLDADKIFDTLQEWVIPAIIVFFLICVVFGIGKSVVAVSNRKPQPAEPEVSDTFGTASFEAARAGLPDQMYIFNGVFFGKSSMPSPAHTAPFEQHQGAPICSTP